MLMDTLTRMLAEAGAAHPDSLFVRFCGRRSEVATLTYSEAWVLACRWAKGLAEHGVRRGDRVVLALPNCEDFVGAFFGTLLAGGVPAALPPLQTLDGDHPSVVSLGEADRVRRRPRPGGAQNPGRPRCPGFPRRD